MSLPDFPSRLDALIRDVIGQLRVDPDGEHGLPHWRRVYRNGLLIAQADPKVDIEVVTLYAILHDSQRETSGKDPEHGVRASRYVQDLWAKGALAWLAKEQANQLKGTCIGHVLRMKHELVNGAARTMAACYDADRLDWPRFGHNPTLADVRSLYAIQPGVIERHIEEAWNPDDPIAIIPEGV